MTDLPVIFSAPMVRALLAGRKTQTRRLASSPLVKVQPGDRLWVRENCWLYGQWLEHGTTRSGKTRRHFKLMGNGVVYHKGEVPGIAYWGGGTGYSWRPSIHMPRWASRLTLIVTNVRFERLQDISDADALAEGIVAKTVIVGSECYGGPPHEITDIRYFYDGCDSEGFETAIDAYAALWDHLHGAGSWDENPELVALTFEVHRCNIDRMGR